SLAYLYGFAYAGLRQSIATGSADDIERLWKVNVNWAETNFGYIVDWRQDAAPWLLAQLLQHNVLVKAAGSPFEVSVDKKSVSFDYGSLLIPIAGQGRTADSLKALLQQLGTKGKINI